MFSPFAAFNSILLILIFVCCIFIYKKINAIGKPCYDIVNKLPPDALGKITGLADKFDQSICVEKKGILFPGFNKLGINIPPIKVC